MNVLRLISQLIGIETLRLTVSINGECFIIVSNFMRIGVYQMWERRWESREFFFSFVLNLFMLMAMRVYVMEVKK